jgi:hypothetical protein
MEKKKDEKAEGLGKKEKNGKSKRKKKGLDIIQQIRDLAEPGPIATKWWKEKGEINFGFAMSSEGLGVRRGITLATIPLFSSLISAIQQELFSLFLRIRSDLVLSGGAYYEQLLLKPEFSQLGGGPALEFVYETLAAQVPSYRKEALRALARWSRLQGNEVTAEQWEKTLLEEARLKDGQGQSTRDSSQEKLLK